MGMHHQFPWILPVTITDAADQEDLGLMQPKHLPQSARLGQSSHCIHLNSICVLGKTLICLMITGWIQGLWPGVYCVMTGILVHTRGAPSLGPLLFILSRLVDFIITAGFYDFTSCIVFYNLAFLSLHMQFLCGVCFVAFWSWSFCLSYCWSMGFSSFCPGFL